MKYTLSPRYCLRKEGADKFVLYNRSSLLRSVISSKLYLILSQFRNSIVDISEFKHFCHCNNIDISDFELFISERRYSDVLIPASTAHHCTIRVPQTNILTKCKEAGLTEINFSTGDDHLEYIPLDYVKNGIDAAVKLNLTVVVNIESGKDRIFNVDEFVKDEQISNLLTSDGISLPRLTIINGVWMPFTQEALPFLPPLDKEIFHPSKDRCKNLFTAITISPTNRLLACCGLPVTYLKHLDLGNLAHHSITTLYNKQFNDFIKIWLFVDGPYKILSFVGEKLKTTIPECEVLSHTCFYCAALFTNTVYLQTVQKHYREVFASVMLRYSFLINQINKTTP